MTALRDVQGIGPFLESQLHEAGYDSVAALAAADPDNLVAVRGIGPVSARQIIAAAADLTLVTRREPSVPESAQDAEKETRGAKKKKQKSARAAKKSKKKNANKAKAKAKKNEKSPAAGKTKKKKAKKNKKKEAKNKKKKKKA